MRVAGAMGTSSGEAPLHGRTCVLFGQFLWLPGEPQLTV